MSRVFKAFFKLLKLTSASQSAAERRSTIVPYVLLALASFLWATNWVIGRAMRDAIPPVSMSFWRWAMAFAILLPFAAKEMADKWPIVRGSWSKLALLGALGGAGYTTLVYVGLQYTPATNGVIFNSISPILIILFSWIAFGERMKHAQLAGVAASFCGVLIIIARGDPDVISALHSYPGDLWLMLAMVLWAVYTLFLRWRPAALSPVGFLVVVAFFSLLILLPFYLWELSVRGGFEITLPRLAALVYYAIFPSILAYLFWHQGVARVGANRAGLFVHLMPAFGAMLAVVFLGETLEIYHLVGVGLIFTGIYLSTGKGRNEPRGRT